MTAKNQFYRCNENGLLYRVLDVSGGEVVATTDIKATEESDSFSWMSPTADFNMCFTHMPNVH